MAYKRDSSGGIEAIPGEAREVKDSTERKRLPGPPENSNDMLASAIRGMFEASLDDIVESVLERSSNKFVDGLGKNERFGDMAQRVIAERLGRIKRRPVQIILPDGKSGPKLENTHHCFEKTLKIAGALGLVWLQGKAGTGKTTLGDQVAAAVDRNFFAVSCSAGLSEGAMTGRVYADGSYIEPEFLLHWEKGGPDGRGSVILLDEFDAVDSNFAVKFNSGLANGYISCEARIGSPTAKRHEKTIVMVATNTWGRGADLDYTGREALDAATRDRFVLAKVMVDYDPMIEQLYLGEFTNKPSTPKGITAQLSRPLQDIFLEVRKAIDKFKLRRVLSTRVFDQALSLRQAGFTDSEILYQFFMDWDESEFKKVQQELGERGGL